MISSESTLQSTSKDIFLLLFILVMAATAYWLPSTGEWLVGLFTTYLLLQLGFAILGLLVGIIQWLFTGKGQKFHNALKLFLGNFYLNENQSFFPAFADGLRRHLWEFPQTFLGHIWAQCLNCVGMVQRVEYFDGATFSITINQKKRSGMSLGSFIYIAIDDAINGEFRQRLIKDPLFMHEFGHRFDSRLLGISYLPFIGLPSLISAAQSKQIIGKRNKAGLHKFQSYEMRANRKAAKYFEQVYEIQWEQFSEDYPLLKVMGR